MKNKKQSPKSSGVVNTILYGTSIVTLAFWTNFGDPFNPIKLMLILAVASWLTGHLITDYRLLAKKRDLKKLYTLSFIFVLSLFIATLKSKVKQVAWIGDYQRNNGFLFYFGLCIFLIATSYYFNWTDLRNLSNSVVLVGLISSVYGVLQITNKDFVEWKNPYNVIILTLGNPNFAGAFMAMVAVLLFGFGILSFRSYRKLILFISLFCVLSILIILSEARQGLLGLIIGCSFILSTLVYRLSKFIGRIIIITLSSLGILAILGMLQMGPLSSIMYKGSVTVRGYYWRAGIAMFRDHFWFGIGIDNYGYYFKQYRELGYPLNYGFDIGSSNAHNTFIQMFSVAGVFTGSAYLLLFAYILWRGIRGLRKKHFNHALMLATIIAAWITWLCTSIISIDSPGLTIWGWVLAGVIVALTSNEAGNRELELIKSPIKLDPKARPTQTLVSSLLIIPILFLSINVFKVESAVLKARINYNPQIEKSGMYLRTFIPSIATNPVINTLQVVELAALMATSGYAAEGIQLLEAAIDQNPRNLDALNLLASYYTELKQPEEAVQIRLRIAKLDPYNAKNYLQLGLNYKSMEDFSSMEKMKELVISFAKDTPEGLVALRDLIP